VSTQVLTRFTCGNCLGLGYVRSEELGTLSQPCPKCTHGWIQEWVDADQFLGRHGDDD
jgi:hypothetical protein